MSRETNQPSPTLFITNIESKVKKLELRKQLYALFTPYGKVLDVVAKKGNNDRGQAFVVFAEQASATGAMRALVGEEFYGRPLRIDYAKTKSMATVRQEDPSVDDPESTSNKQKKKNQIVTASRAEQEYTELEKERQAEEEGKGKRDRDGEAEGEDEEAGGDKKRRKVDEGEDDDEEMEMDEDDDDKAVPATRKPNAPSVPTVLLASNLPQETTQEALANLFEQYPGYQTITLLPAGSTPTKSASIVFGSLQQAESVQNELDGFKLKPDWSMAVVVVPADALA